MADPALARLEQWVGSHQAVVYRAARMIVGDAAAAEDIAQETFLRAYRSADRVGAEADVGPWLYRIAVNLSLNRLRSQRRERLALGRLGPRTEVVVEVPDAGVAAANRRGVTEALVRLPDHLRVPVVLRYYLDLPEREIARVMAIRPGTVKSRLHQARQRLAADDALVSAVEERER